MSPRLQVPHFVPRKPWVFPHGPLFPPPKQPPPRRAAARRRRRAPRSRLRAADALRPGASPGAQGCHGFSGSIPSGNLT